MILLEACDILFPPNLFRENISKTRVIFHPARQDSFNYDINKLGGKKRNKTEHQLTGSCLTLR